MIVLPTNPEVVLPCQASGYPQPKIRWSRHEASLPENSVVHSNGSLVIAEFFSRDNGRYVCRAENNHGHVTHSTDVSVYGGEEHRKPMLNNSKFYLPVAITHGLEVINNTKAVIKCTVCPFQKLTFDWTREDGKDLPPTRKKINKCSLEISPVLMQDAGYYTCTASSGSQVLKDRVFLTVLGSYLLTAILFLHTVIFCVGKPEIKTIVLGTQQFCSSILYIFFV